MTTPDAPMSASPVDWDRRDLMPLLELEELDTDLFRNRVNEINMNGSLFGGQVLSQALHAAIRSVDDSRPPHSLHGYFLRPGAGDRLVVYQVERTRDGGSFSTRRITALQKGRPIFHMEASFHAAEPGFDHQTKPALAAPAPDGLEDLAALAERYADRLDPAAKSILQTERSVEIRPTDPERQLFERDEDPRISFWLRMTSAASAAARLHVCAMAYASDLWLAAAARKPHAKPMELAGFQLASLDHAMWFHAPIKAGEWHLYEVESPWTGAGRGMTRGVIFDRGGGVVASIAQEVLLRPRRAGA